MKLFSVLVLTLTLAGVFALAALDESELDCVSLEHPHTKVSEAKAAMPA